MKRKLTNALLIANYAMTHADTNIEDIVVSVWIDRCRFAVRAETKWLYNNSSVGSSDKVNIINALNAIGTHSDIIICICNHADGTRSLLFSNYDNIVK